MRSLLPVVAVGGFLATSSAAYALPPTTSTQTIAIHRTAGHCPTSIVVKTVTQQYEGGATFDVTAQTLSAAYTSTLVSATPQIVRFHASLRPTYATCAATGHAGQGDVVTLAAGALTFVMHLSAIVGPNGTGPGLLLVSVENGLPRVRYALTD